MRELFSGLIDGSTAKRFNDRAHERARKKRAEINIRRINSKRKRLERRHQMRKSRLAAKWAKRKDMLRRRAVPKGIPFDEKAFDAKFRAQIKKLDDKNSKKQKRLNEEENSLKMELTVSLFVLTHHFEMG